MVTKSHISVFFLNLLIIGNFFIVLPAYGQEARNGATLASSALSGSANQGPVKIGGPWIQFSFQGDDSFATGCAPADPAGTGCVPSSSGNSIFGDAPPWTFKAPRMGAILKMTDAFSRGDIFEVFDFGVSIGTTSPVGPGGDCGDDPELCLLDPLASNGIFSVGPGLHEITIKALVSPAGVGAAYFRVDVAKRKLDHMLCYEVEAHDEFEHREIGVRNQFGKQSYTVIRPDTICVPSSKTEIKRRREETE